MLDDIRPDSVAKAERRTRPTRQSRAYCGGLAHFACWHVHHRADALVRAYQAQTPEPLHVDHKLMRDS